MEENKNKITMDDIKALREPHHPPQVKCGTLYKSGTHLAVCDLTRTPDDRVVLQATGEILAIENNLGLVPRPGTFGQAVLVDGKWELMQFECDPHRGGASEEIGRDDE